MDTKQILDYYINIGKNNTKKYKIALVANVRGKTKNYVDFDSSSVINEYFSLTLYEEIQRTLRNAGYEVCTFFDEDDFIKAVLENKIGNLEQLIVMNSSQKGTHIGRKSLVPAFCGLHNIKFTGSNAYVVSLCRNKFHTNCISQNRNLYTPDTYIYNLKYGWISGKPTLGEKVIIKLNNEACSIGMTKKNIIKYDENSYEIISTMAKEFRQDIILQKFICGFEVEVPIIMGKNVCSLDPVGIELNNEHFLGQEILDYEIRGNHSFEYFHFKNQYPEISEKIKKNSAQIGKLLGIEGIGRIDYRITENGEAFVTDIATNPHITSISSIATAFSWLEYSYTDMFYTMIGLSIEKYV